MIAPELRKSNGLQSLVDEVEDYRIFGGYLPIACPVVNFVSKTKKKFFGQRNEKANNYEAISFFIFIAF